MAEAWNSKKGCVEKYKKNLKDCAKKFVFYLILVTGSHENILSKAVIRFYLYIILKADKREQKGARLTFGKSVRLCLFFHFLKIFHHNKIFILLWIYRVYVYLSLSNTPLLLSYLWPTHTNDLKEHVHRHCDLSLQEVSVLALNLPLDFSLSIAVQWYFTIR